MPGPLLTKTPTLAYATKGNIQTPNTTAAQAATAATAASAEIVATYTVSVVGDRP